MTGRVKSRPMLHWTSNKFNVSSTYFCLICYILCYHIFGEIKLCIQGGPKNRPLYSSVYSADVFVYIYIPCELKLCPIYIEAETKLVCQQVVQTYYNRVKAPAHHYHYVTMAKHNSNGCLCLYPSNSSVQRRDSQVNNCSVCPPWTWTTAFNRGRHWSTALLMICWSRLAQQVFPVELGRFIYWVPVLELLKIFA